MSDVASAAIDVSRLPRSPGSLLEISKVIPAPPDLSVTMARVVEGSAIDVDISLESVVEGIWVSGTADVHVTAECSRCLDPVEWSETVALEQLYRYPATDASGALVSEEEDPDDDPDPEVRDDTIDVESALRDAVVLALPLAPLCSPDCGGICAQCGERIASLDEPHEHPAADPRWAALEALLENPDEGGKANSSDR